MSRSYCLQRTVVDHLEHDQGCEARKRKKEEIGTASDRNLQEFKVLLKSQAQGIGLFMSAATNQMGCLKASSGRFRSLFQRVRRVAVKAGVIYSKKGKTEDQTNQV